MATRVAFLCGSPFVPIYHIPTIPQVDDTMTPGQSPRRVQAAAGTITRLSDLIKLLE